MKPSAFSVIIPVGILANTKNDKYAINFGFSTFPDGILQRELWSKKQMVSDTIRPILTLSLGFFMSLTSV